MAKYIKIFLIILIFAFSTKIAFAGYFGGTVLTTKAVSISVLEKAGWACVVPGRSTTIYSKDGTAQDFLIPAWVTSKSKNNTLSIGLNTLGFYSGTTTITCLQPCGPNICTTTTKLNTLYLFGLSGL